MTNSRVTGVRSIELGVRDLHQSAEFYTKVWALEEVSSDGDSIHFRATGGEHHVLTIRERPQASLLGVHFAAADRDAVDQLCAKAKGYGVELAGDPAPLDGERRRRLRLSVRDARRAADEHIVGQRAASECGAGSLAPDQDQPRRSQQRAYR